MTRRQRELLSRHTAAPSHRDGRGSTFPRESEDSSLFSVVRHYFQLQTVIKIAAYKIKTEKKAEGVTGIRTIPFWWIFFLWSCKPRTKPYKAKWQLSPFQRWAAASFILASCRPPGANQLWRRAVSSLMSEVTLPEFMNPGLSRTGPEELQAGSVTGTWAQGSAAVLLELSKQPGLAVAEPTPCPLPAVLWVTELMGWSGWDRRMAAKPDAGPRGTG